MDHNNVSYFDGDIQVKDVLTPNDTDSIAALVAAVQHDTRGRVLDLGFDRIDVPPKNCLSIVLESRIHFSIHYLWYYIIRYKTGTIAT